MALKIGDRIPSISLPNAQGQTVHLENFIGKKPLVIFFYPKNFTPGCTAEACAFRDSYQDFVELGAEVIGISSDTQESHQKFVNSQNLPYTLLSDEKQIARKAFGVPGNFLGLLPGRVTYIADLEGIIRHIFNSQLNASQHIHEALKVLRSLKSTQS